MSKKIPRGATKCKLTFVIELIVNMLSNGLANCINICLSE